MTTSNSFLSLVILLGAGAAFACDGDDGTAPGAPAATNGAASGTDAPGTAAPGAVDATDGEPGATSPGDETGAVDGVDSAVPGDEEPVTTASLFATSGLGEDVDAGWKGYLFTTSEEPSLGTTIDPGEGEEFVGNDLCASGTVAADEGYGGFAMLGWNISQTINEETFEGEEANEIVTSGTGITYNIVNNNPSTSLRIQIQDNSETDEGRWCANVVGSTGTLLWSDFNTKCWDGSGDDFSAGTSISSIAVHVPGGASDGIPFDFCIVDLKQAD